MAQTIFDTFGVRVDHYLQIDFCAFKTIVEAVGGVKVPFEYPARDDRINLHIDAVGCHTFGGDEALAYVRSRYYEYQDTDGRWKSDNAYDLGRVSRQQDFLRRLLAAADAKGVFNASVARGLLDTLTDYVVVDQNLTIDGMLQFLGVLQNVRAEGVPTYQIESKRLIVQNNDVLDPQLDTESMAAILAIFRGQTTLSAAPGTGAESRTRPPRWRKRHPRPSRRIVPAGPRRPRLRARRLTLPRRRFPSRWRHRSRTAGASFPPPTSAADRQDDDDRRSPSLGWRPVPAPGAPMHGEADLVCSYAPARCLTPGSASDGASACRETRPSWSRRRSPSTSPRPISTSSAIGCGARDGPPTWTTWIGSTASSVDGCRRWSATGRTSTTGESTRRR
jgi:LCP family protein required for cell wall assembly